MCVSLCCCSYSTRERNVWVGFPPPPVWTSSLRQMCLWFVDEHGDRADRGDHQDELGADRVGVGSLVTREKSLCAYYYVWCGILLMNNNRSVMSLQYCGLKRPGYYSARFPIARNIKCVRVSVGQEFFTCLLYVGFVLFGVQSALIENTTAIITIGTVSPRSVEVKGST